MKQFLEKIEALPVWAFALILGATAFLQFANTRSNGYALDDTIVISANERVQNGLSDPGSFFVQRKSEKLQDQYGYRPISLMSFALDVELFGKDDPRSAHTMNILYFALVAVVLFFVLRRLFPQARTLLPFLVALLFVVHPLHVEAVANIKSRDEILALLFCLLSLGVFIQWVDEGKIWRVPLALVLILLGFLSRENAVTYLAVVPLVVLLRTPKPQLLDWGKAFLLPVIAGLVMGVIALTARSGTEDAMALTEGQGIYMESKIMGNAIFQDHQFHERLATGIGIMLRYLKLFLVPYPLVYYSGFNQIPLTSFADPLVWASVVVHLGLLVLAVRFFRKHPILTFGIGYYFITLSIYTHIARPLSDAMADRFMFSPSLGLGLVLVYGLMLAFRIPVNKGESGKESGKQKGKGKKNALDQGEAQRHLGFGVLMTALILTFAGLTFQRNKAWKDNLTLFTNDIPNLEDCARCNFHYAEALTGIYEQSSEKPRLQQEIIRHFKRAIEITPKAYNSYISLGRAYYVFGMFAEGDALLEEAVENYPEQGRPFFHLGYGKFAQQKWKEAVPPLEKTVELTPKRSEGHFYLAWAHFNGDNHSRGIEVMEKAARDFPAELSLHESLSDMYMTEKDSANGFRALYGALEQAPTHRGIYEKLIGRYNEWGDTTTAMQVYRDAQGKGIF